MIFKVFTVTRNEYDLIEDFINHYANIVGYENVHIIDNNSDNESVLNIYKSYSEKGITIHNAPTYIGGGQGEAFTEVMAKYKNECDYMLGIDTDEFLVVLDERGIPIDVDFTKIVSEYPHEYSLFQIAGQRWCSVVDSECDGYVDGKMINPVKDICNFKRETYIEKFIFRGKDFLKTSNGNHRGQVSRGKSVKMRDVGVIHYHDTGKRRLKERCEQIMVAYDYVNLDRSLTDRIDIIERNKARWRTGYHRVHQYYIFLLIELLIDECIKQKKQPPVDCWNFITSIKNLSKQVLLTKITKFEVLTNNYVDKDRYMYYESPFHSAESINFNRVRNHLVEDLQT